MASQIWQILGKMAPGIADSSRFVRAIASDIAIAYGICVRSIFGAPTISGALQALATFARPAAGWFWQTGPLFER